MDERKYMLLRVFIVSFSIFLGIMLNRILGSARFKAEIAECKRRKQLKIAERTLGIKLYKWQRAYILDEITFIPLHITTTRCTGKTLAQCLKLCLSDGAPLDSRYIDVTLKSGYNGYASNSANLLWWQIDVWEDKMTPERYRNFLYELQKMYEKLSQNKKLKLRKITFNAVF